MNHFARVRQSSTNRVEEVLDNTESGMNLDELFIDFMNVDVINHQNKLLSTINVNGADITFKVDTGAQCNILPLQVFNKIRNRPTLDHCTMKLTTYGGNTINPVGKCEMNITTKHQSEKADFFIVKVENTKPLLGLKTCHRLNIININSVENAANTDSIIEEYSEIFTGLGHVEGEYHQGWK